MRGNQLAQDFERTGNINVLDEAVVYAFHAFRNTSPYDEMGLSRCHNLGTLLGRRYENTGAFQDLDYSILLMSIAAQSTPQDHPYRASRLISLATWLGRRYERNGQEEDFENALQHLSQAVGSVRSPMDYPTYMMNIVNLLAWKFRWTGSTQLLNEAIDLTRQAMTTHYHELQCRADWLSNLGTLLHWRYQLTGNARDLDDAVYHARAAAQGISDIRPCQATLVSNLADLLVHDYQRVGHRDQAWNPSVHHLEVWKCANAPPRIRLRAALKTADSFISHELWKEASGLLCEAVEFLSSMSSRSLNHIDLQYFMREFAGLATLTASVVIQAHEDVLLALRMLELGRGIMLSLHLRMPGIDPSSGSTIPSSVRRGFHQQSNCYREERLFDFRTPPSTPQLTSSASSPPGQRVREPHMAVFKSQLLEAAQSGPVVILNASRIRCDAIIITSKGLRSVWLRQVRNEDICDWVTFLQQHSVIGHSQSEHPSKLQECLVWLWEVIASPILDVLGFKETPLGGSPWPRLWWIPTGSLSQLPIHAAGQHGRPGHSVLDRVVSSYSRSLAALITARRDSSNIKVTPSKHLLTSMVETPGLPTLRFAGKEIDAVAGLFEGAIQTSLQGPKKKDILACLQDCDILHFAGHGISHPVDPLKSCLALEDWREDPLTVETLLSLERRRVKPPFLAYLSACSTGQNLAKDLQDESINLMSAFQSIGFRHTVGFLWEMSDALLVEAAKKFYAELRRAGTAHDWAVALSVHTTSRHIRDLPLCSGTNNGAWAAYIHFGP